ncbi:MAG TPA: CoA transferase [Alphaproteobacteria bacterium]|jgi:crotonobetainyl-CoA:carnitine CoA-transferase CaiB-like acyl-CoA transferase
MTAKTGPLVGLRVLELAHVMAGPTCGLMLADLGADVIKVERVPGGDDTRRSVPPEVNGESAAFMMMNRNKRGIALDLKHPSAREVLLRLVRKTDVLIENYRRDTMAKLGLGYDALKEVNPALIYCEISGFGRTGPYADRGGFDLIAQGMSGLMSITGEGPGRPPVKVGAPVTDITAGILGALGCVSAYVERLRTGKGQRVDTSLFEAGITHTYWQSAIAFATGIAPGPMGSAHPLNAPYQAFATADGWINIGAANHANWDRFTRVIGAPELRDDPRFEDNRGRMANLALLVETLAPYLAKRSSADWLARFEGAGLPAGPVLSVSEMHADPQALARDMVVETTHPKAGRTKAIGLPIKLSATPGGIRQPAPLFGQHTREVLGEAGYSAEEIGDLAEAGAVVCG